MIYVLLVIALLLLILLCCYRRKSIDLSRNTALLLILFFTICALVMGLRGISVGADTSTYSQYFELYKNTSFSEVFSVNQIEPGYVFLMKICSMICGNYIFFQIVVSFLICYGLAKFIYDNSKYAVFVTEIFLGIGLYTWSFNATRQAFAVMLVANSWTFLTRGKHVRALILILIAITMHASAFVFLLAYIIYIFRNNRYVLGVLILAAIIAAINYRSVIGFISTYLSRYSSYYDNSRTIMSAGLVRVVWIIILVFSLYLIFKRNISAWDRMIGVLSFIYVLCMFVGLYFNYFQRVGFYFAPIALLLFDSIGGYFENKNTRQIYYVGTSACFLIFFLLSAMTSSQFVYTAYWTS